MCQQSLFEIAQKWLIEAQLDFTICGMVVFFDREIIGTISALDCSEEFIFEGCRAVGFDGVEYHAVINSSGQSIWQRQK